MANKTVSAMKHKGSLVDIPDELFDVLSGSPYFQMGWPHGNAQQELRRNRFPCLRFSIP